MSHRHARSPQARMGTPPKQHPLGNIGGTADTSSLSAGAVSPGTGRGTEPGVPNWLLKGGWNAMDDDDEDVGFGNRRGGGGGNGTSPATKGSRREGKALSRNDDETSSVGSTTPPMQRRLGAEEEDGAMTPPATTPPLRPTSIYARNYPAYPSVPELEPPPPPMSLPARQPSRQNGAPSGQGTNNNHAVSNNVHDTFRQSRVPAGLQPAAQGETASVDDAEEEDAAAMERRAHEEVKRHAALAMERNRQQQQQQRIPPAALGPTTTAPPKEYEVPSPEPKKRGFLDQQADEGVKNTKSTVLSTHQAAMMTSPEAFPDPARDREESPDIMASPAPKRPRLLAVEGADRLNSLPSGGAAAEGPPLARPGTLMMMKASTPSPSPAMPTPYPPAAALYAQHVDSTIENDQLHHEDEEEQTERRGEEEWPTAAAATPDMEAIEALREHYQSEVQALLLEQRRIQQQLAATMERAYHDAKEASNGQWVLVVDDAGVLRVVPFTSSDPDGANGHDNRDHVSSADTAAAAATTSSSSAHNNTKETSAAGGILQRMRDTNAALLRRTEMRRRKEEEKELDAHVQTATTRPAEPVVEEPPKTLQPPKPVPKAAAVESEKVQQKQQPQKEPASGTSLIDRRRDQEKEGTTQNMKGRRGPIIQVLRPLSSSSLSSSRGNMEDDAYTDPATVGVSRADLMLSEVYLDEWDPAESALYWKPRS